METQRPRRAVEQNCSRLKKKLFPFEKLPVFPFEKLRAFPFKKLLGAGGGGTRLHMQMRSILKSTCESNWQDTCKPEAFGIKHVQLVVFAGCKLE